MLPRSSTSPVRAMPAIAAIFNMGPLLCYCRASIDILAQACGGHAISPPGSASFRDSSQAATARFLMGISKRGASSFAVCSSTARDRWCEPPDAPGNQWIN
jgi:hypothetical protein